MEISLKQLSRVHKSLMPVKLLRSLFCSSAFYRKSFTTSATVPTTGNKYFVTTPIFYVNAAPHLGHLYSATLADAAHRYRRLNGATSTIFSTGTDEHGLKIQQAAANSNILPFDFCTQNSDKFRGLFNTFDIDFSHFIRTTSSEHGIAVNKFINTIKDNGFIYKGEYSGWYSIPDESFLTESQVEDRKTDKGKVIKVSSESGHVVEWNSESNYMFSLSKFEDDLKYWLKCDNRVKPRRFLEDLRNMVERGLKDLSVSRPKSRVCWGVDMPGDEEHSVYVWVDALVNYLTVAGYPHVSSHWPADLHVLGKDILYFHGVFWPALLIAAGMEPPRQLLVHSHWTVDGIKMSKSLGNVVCPYDLKEKMTMEGVRYLLLRQGTPHSDGSWRTKEGINLLNSELADSLGNLVHRCTGKSLNKSQVFPKLYPGFVDKSFHARQVLQTMKHAKEEVSHCYEDFNFYQGIDHIMSMVKCANLMVQEEKPWTLKNRPEDLDSVIHLALSAGRAAALMLLPIVPNYCNKLLDTLAVPKTHRTWKNIDTYPSEVHNPLPLGERSPPFKKINM